MTKVLSNPYSKKKRHLGFNLPVKLLNSENVYAKYLPVHEYIYSLFYVTMYQQNLRDCITTCMHRNGRILVPLAKSKLTHTDYLLHCMLNLFLLGRLHCFIFWCYTHMIQYIKISVLWLQSVIRYAVFINMKNNNGKKLGREL